MWPTLDRARRRISGGSGAPGDAPPAETPPESPPTVDEVIVLGGADLDRLEDALQRELGRRTERLDTPYRIEHALSAFMARRDLVGRPRVLRRPAGLSTPQSWEIHLDGVDRETSDAVRDASRTGSFAR